MEVSAVEIEVLGDGAFAGSVANVADYTVSESGSPLSLVNLQSGVGGVSFGVVEQPGVDGSVLLSGQPFELRDPYSGVQRGVIDGATISGEGMMEVQASTALLPLVSERTANAYAGTLAGALTYYFGLCGMASGFQVDPIIGAKPVNLPSWTANVWAQVKKLEAIHQFEVADVAGAVVVRPLRQRTVEVRKYETTRLHYGRVGASQIVEVHYYNNEMVSNRQVYPKADTDLPDRPIISVGASETLVTNYPVQMWVESIDHPDHITSLPPEWVATSSVYSVVDKDGTVVTPGDWTNGGGEVTFAVGEDRKSIDVTVRGMSTQDRAPYKIASSSDDGEYQFAALYIVASGMAFEDKVIWSHTGADIVDAPSDSVTTIDDPMVSSRAEAATVLANAIMESNGFSQTLEASATAVNRRGETGQIISMSFQEWDAIMGVRTFAQFDTSQGPNKTFGQYDTELASGYIYRFENQALGGIGGARVDHRNNLYRIRTGDTSPFGHSWSAESDLLFSDWDNSHDGKTFAEFDAFWGARTFEQHARTPLSGGGEWVDYRRNYVTKPEPTATPITPVWSTTTPNLLGDGWVGGTVNTTTTPYIFVGNVQRAFSKGEQLTLRINLEVTALDAGPRYISVMPHLRTGNVYYRGAGNQTVVPATIGADQEVVLRWTVPADIPAGTGLDISLVTSSSDGATFHAVGPGFAWRARWAMIESGWTSGSYYGVDASWAGEGQRIKWAGPVGNSESTLQRYVPRVG